MRIKEVLAMATLVHTYTVKMSTQLRERLERLARAQDRKPADCVRRLIRLACEEYEAHQAAAQGKASGEGGAGEVAT